MSKNSETIQIQPSTTLSFGGTARAFISRRPWVGAAFSTLIVFIIFAAIAPHFTSAEALTSIALVAAQLAIVASAVTLLMIAGEYDLSVGAVLALCSMLTAFLASTFNISIPLVIVISLLASAAIGALHGTLVVKWAIPSFIATLGGLMFWRSMVYLISGGYPVSVPPGSSTLALLSERFPNGLSMGLFWCAVVLLAAHWVLEHTKWGNWIFATGGDPQAARVKGVPVKKVKIWLFVLTAVLACFAGIIQLGRFGTVDANRGMGMELEAIAAAVIGGTSLNGCVGSIVGTLLGCVIIAMIQQGLALINMPPAVYQALLGILVVGAVLTNRAIEKRARK
ncbi:ABC transporter permease [Pantoea cypripedii]|uniref:Xylose transport system permease protein XylH n=1 Tax=Pantoea cypripedii TaxID=55209 RepID=A0A6B9GGE1_PANCY|nr:ABC transporter permease [Pantoea cypripedii]QGY32949.1 ABC transporter permease [Pantoea cypripedii]